MREKTILEAALWYQDRGFSVIPIEPGGKRPFVAWTEWQTTRASADQVREWFQGRSRNIGIVCGAGSFNLVVRDFDEAWVYEAWKAANPDLAKELPTVQTSRGFHVYCRSKEEIDTDTDAVGGEIRAKGAYVVAPPSTHGSGGGYVWTRDWPDTVLTVSQEALNSLRTPPTTSYKSNSPECLDVWLNQTTPGGTLTERIESAIRRTLPPTPGTRRHSLFLFARALKAIPEAAEKTSGDLLDLLRDWHQRALANETISTKAFSATVQDFGEMWVLAKYAEGDSPLDRIHGKAKLTTFPKAVSDTDAFSQNMRELARLCRELQRESGQDPFFLGCEPAGRLLKVSPQFAARMLKSLCGLGILKRIETGTKASKEASTYRYLKPLDE